LIPLVDSIVVQIDAAAKTIVVDPPEGLLDL
jgi:ribosomal 30S subunit maturation factor RimM